MYSFTVVRHPSIGPSDHLFILSPACSFIHSFIHWLVIHSFVNLFTHSVGGYFIYSCAVFSHLSSLAYLITHSFTHTFIPSLGGSLIHHIYHICHSDDSVTNPSIHLITHLFTIPPFTKCICSSSSQLLT